MFILNIKEGADDIAQEERVKDFSTKVRKDETVMTVDVKTLGEVEMMDESQKDEFIDLLGTVPILLPDIIRETYKQLHLITFYTGSEKECNAWSVVEGASAKDAAGVIHTDLAEGFVTADVVNVEQMIEAGGFQKAKESGVVRNQGKDYLVKDGDYILIYSTN